jgi:hypothetical protein
VDYKGIANAGTWAIGRLQTEQDRDRLLDGMSSAGGGVDTRAVADLVAGLEKRHFVLRQPGEPAPMVFESRWALTYLRGPFTRDNLAALHPATGSTGRTGSPDDQIASSPLPVAPPVSDDEVEVVPKAADGIAVRWLDPAAAWAPGPGPRLEAALALRFQLTYDETSPDVRHVEEWEAVLHPLTDPIDLGALRLVDHDDRDLRAEPPAGARYALPAAPIGTKAYAERVRKAVTDHLVASRTLQVFVNRELKLASRPGEDRAAFALRCEAAADDRADAEAVEIRRKSEAKLMKAREAARAAADRVADAQARAEHAHTEEVASGAGSLLGALLGGRRRARSLARAAAGAASRRSRTQEASTKVGTARNRMAEKEAAVDRLEAEVVDDLLTMATRWDETAAAIEPLDIPLEKADVRMAAMSLVWVPAAKR